jgi:NAD(P)-dependent dehydrogenase (short-subunit alcohol dehydrogenase family)
MEPPKTMRAIRKTMIVTGASKGIGAGVTNAFIERGYNVVANSLNITASTFAATDRVAVVQGDIGDPSTAQEIASTAIQTFGSIDGVVNNAGIFFTKPFTDYTTQDFEKLSGTNLQGYINITQIAVKQMLRQNSGGSVTCVTSAMVEHPIAGINASLAMVTKGGLEAITRSLAMEYAKEGIRFNAVAPGEVNTPMHANDSREFLKSLSPMGEIEDVADIVDAIVYLTEARHVTGEVLHVDAGAHNGKW